MATRILMPKLGLTMTEGTIIEWVVNAGDQVSEGAIVMLIETDKVEAEVEAVTNGIVSHTASVGDTLEPGETVGWILGEGEQAPDGTLVETTTGETQDGDELVEPVEQISNSDKPVAEINQPEIIIEQSIENSESSRVLASPNAKRVAEELNIVIGDVSGTGPSGRITSDDVHSHAASKESDSTHTGRIMASPNAKRVARETGIDLAAITGTGPGGRITSEDVLAAPPVETELERTEPTPVAATPKTEPSGQIPFAARKAAERLGVDVTQVAGTGPNGRITKQDVFIFSRAQKTATQSSGSHPSPEPISGERIPIKGMRGIIAERMHSSLQEMAQLTLTMDVNMQRAVELREQLKDIGQEELGAVPGYTDLVIAAVAQALTRHPLANSQIDGNDIVLLEEINVGMAVAVQDGLVVPVVHRADQLELAEIAMETSRLAEAARNKKLSLSEMEGGTFSVTALGMFGVDAFTPVINPPNSGILGVGRIRDDVEWDGDTPIRVKKMTISLTWDHRVLDGAPAAEFAATIKSLLEKPIRLLS